MYCKKTVILVFCLIIEICLAQDAVFYVRKKLQEQSKISDEQQNIINKIVAGDKFALQSFDINLYDGNYLEKFSNFSQNGTFNFKCLQDLLTVQQDLLRPRHREYVLMMLDSQGKMPAGLMEFNTRWLGNYAECTRAEKIVDGKVEIRGKYCKASILFGLGRQAVCVPHTCTADDLQAIYSFNDTEEGSGEPDELLNVPNVVECVEDIPWITGDYVTLALCGVICLILCIGTFYDVFCRLQKNNADNNDKVTLTELQNYTPKHNPTLANGINSSDTLNGHILTGQENGAYTRTTDEESMKPPAENKPSFNKESVPRTENMHISKERNLGHEVLLSFSILTNGEKLFNFSSAGGQLQAINGLRALSFGWVILGHTYSFMFLYIDNLTVLDSYRPIPAYQLITSGVYAVDTFFFLSGLLVAFTTLKLLHKTKGRLNWALFYVHRYIRLSVIYGFTILLMATLWRHVVQGVFQNKIADGRQGEVDPVACQKYWWTNLLYINNFYPDDSPTTKAMGIYKYLVYGSQMTVSMCHGVGWYMANDMQFFIISPLYIYLLYKKRIIGHLLVLTAIVTSFMANGIISSKYDLTSLMFGTEQQTAEQSHYQWMIYARPYYRMGAYFVGISAGELLLHKPKLNKFLICIGWILAIGLHYLLIFGLYPYYENGGIGMSTGMDALFNATHRTVWALSLAWIVYACSHGLGGPINWFLSWKIWVPISRLSFAGYLCHPMVMFAIIASLQRLIHMNDYSVTMLFLASITAVLPVSTVLSLGIEAPVMRLQKLLLGSK